jgi:hypothetical protein
MARRGHRAAPCSGGIAARFEHLRQRSFYSCFSPSVTREWIERRPLSVICRIPLKTKFV